MKRTKFEIKTVCLLLLSACLIKVGLSSYGATPPERTKPTPSAKKAKPTQKGESESADNATSPGIAPPRFKVIPLTEVQSVYESLQNEPLCVKSFCVSRDGKHCASFKRLGLNSWIVQIDGRQGPEFTSTLKGEVFPTDDFEQVFFWVRDMNSKENLVVQERNGSAKFYETSAPQARSKDAWVVDVDASLRHRRLIRAQPAGKNNGIAFKVDDPGTVVGPFLHRSGGLIFDSGRRHYMFSDLFESEGGWQQAVFVDGVRVCADILKGPESPQSQSKAITQEFVSTNGAYFIRVQTGNAIQDILNGRKIATYSGEDRGPETTVFSSDGQHVANVLSTGRGVEILVDGKAVYKQPVGSKISGLQFTSDGQGLLYSVTASAQQALFQDGQEITLGTEGPVENFWAGPHQGQYACLIKSPGPGLHLQLVINGRRLDYGQTADPKKKINHAPETVGFSADGEHMFGFYYNALEKWVDFFADGAAARPEMAGKPGKPAKPFRAQRVLDPIKIDPSHWQLVVINDLATAAQADIPAFARIDVEMPSGL
jgi:hypothetical protein